MKFKEYLTEAASYNRTTSELMSQSRLPLTDKVTKSLGYGRNAIAYHATTIEYLKNLTKLGKSKKQLSTFSHGLGSLLNAISVKPDVVAKLEGRSVIDFSFDIFSHPDKDGLRWISTRGNKKSDFFQQAINTKVINLMLSYYGSTDSIDAEYNFDDLFYDDFVYQKVFNTLTTKQKNEVIKLYFDNIAHLLENKMYIDIVTEIINSSDKKVGSYDEIIMNRFKVIGVYSVENGRYKFDQSMAQYDIEKLGYKYLGHIKKEGFNSFGK
jgi:hypothetical protein